MGASLAIARSVGWALADLSTVCLGLAVLAFEIVSRQNVRCLFGRFGLRFALVVPACQGLAQSGRPRVVFDDLFASIGPGAFLRTLCFGQQACRSNVVHLAGWPSLSGLRTLCDCLKDLCGESLSWLDARPLQKYRNIMKTFDGQVSSLTDSVAKLA